MSVAKKQAAKNKEHDTAKTAGPKKTIECPKCKKVHEVDAARDGEQFTCECGQVLDTDPLSQAKTGGGGKKKFTPAAWKTRFMALGKNWKVAVSLAAIVAILAVLALTAFFLRSPSFVLGSGFSGTYTPPKVRDNPEPYLRMLEDNSRQAEHQKAAAELLGMHDSTIVPKLCELAKRDGLAAHKLILQLLGQWGDDRSLATLEQQAGGADLDLSRQAAAAITQIGTPTAESVVMKLIAPPAKARDLLETIAGVRNDTAGRVLSSCLQRPALRSQAIDLSGRFRLARCTEPLSLVARDRELSDADRLASLEALGRINLPESRKILRSLVEDSTVGFKAREIIGKNEKAGDY